MNKRIDQPSLFDAPDVAVTASGRTGAVEGANPSGAPPPEWQEVPAALFLSWSDARQLEYCARRDEETMLNENDEVSDWWMDFYAERSRAYRQLVEGMR